YDMTLTQYKILAYLYEAPQGSTRQVDLERAFCMTNPSVTSVLHTLENKELICRSGNPEDGRSKVISLTDKANTMRSELETAGDKLENAFVKNLSQAERDETVQLLTKLLNNRNV
ncbi:MAG: MarR family transcriptional regulator, partial [Clostridia bacterium]|nr:MarR family transcriptional regulator [Clostridia bacterium]